MDYARLNFGLPFNCRTFHTATLMNPRPGQGIPCQVTVRNQSGHGRQKLRISKGRKSDEFEKG